jgi:hypothetical protein
LKIAVIITIFTVFKYFPQENLSVLTSSFRTYTGPGRISIARSARRVASGFKVYRALAPGPWFRSVSAEEYLTRYAALLTWLDPQDTWDRLHELAGAAEPVLLCWEAPPFTHTFAIPTADAVAGPSNWCHRRLVAAWFKHELGHDVPELSITAPALPR